MNDYTDDLAAVEQSLRLVVERVGRDSFGQYYFPGFGVSAQKVAKWKTARDREQNNRRAGVPEDRLLYFSDLSDLQDIILTNWGRFEPVFRRRDQTEVFLAKLRELRNPDAHRRELAASEKALVSGIAGELRTLVARYLSERDTPDEYFPRMESLRDSLGNSMNPPKRPVVRVGAVIEFIAEAWDPFGAVLEYQWNVSPQHPDTSQEWSPANRFVWKVQPAQIANPAWVSVNMRSPRAHHAEGHRDAGWSIAYTVLPEFPGMP